MSADPHRPPEGRWALRPVPDDLVVRWCEAGHWDEATLGEVLDRGLADHGDQVFRIHSDVRPWEGTFDELRRRAQCLARALIERGVAPGDPVAFQLPNWVEAAVTFYGATMAGAVVVPIVHFYGPKEVAYILGRTGVQVLVTAAAFGHSDFLHGLEQMGEALDTVHTVAVVGGDGRVPELPATGAGPGGRSRVLSFEDLEAEGAAGPVRSPVAVDPSSPALIAYTSGTTADPKGVIHTHRTIGCEVRQLGAMDANQSRPALVGAPVGHAIGMLGALLIPVTKGHPVNLVDVWDPPRLLELMDRYGLACGSGATFFLTSLLDHPDWNDRHRELMHFVGLGGAAVPEAVAERAGSLGISLVRMYGSTEHPSITGSTHDDPERLRHRTDGRPLAGVEIRLVDDAGLPVGTGQPGEIWSRGPDCCMGYTDPALTAEMFDADGWYRTEDVGIVDDEGCLTITDRKKDIIIRGGENISAAEVEELVAAMAGVAEVAVVGRPHPRLGEQACAVVRMAPGSDCLVLSDIQDHLAAAGLARQKWPEVLVLVDELPRTPSGKVQKAVLRRRLRQDDAPAVRG